jgi:hypothetical protein
MGRVGRRTRRLPSGGVGELMAAPFPDMQIEILTLCKEARYSGQFLDIIGAFDVFLSKRAPVLVPQCALAGRVRFERIEEGPHQLRILFMDPDGKLVVPEVVEDLQVAITRDLPTVYKAFALQFAQIKLQEFGEYAIKLAVDRIILASVPIYFLKSE